MQVKELTYEQYVQEFFDEMKKRRAISLYGSYFSDDPDRRKGSKYNWYRKECKKLEEEYQEQVPISEERMKEIMEFVKIEEYRREHLEKREMSVLEKASEYRAKVVELERDIKNDDQLYFSNGERMYGWLYSANIFAKKDLDDESSLTKERIEEIDALGELSFLVNEVFYKKQRLSFDEKASEYLVKLYELGRDMKNNEDIRFSNGENMPRWFDVQVKSLRITTLKKGHMDEHRFSVLANILDSKIRLQEENMANDETYVASINQYAESEMRKYSSSETKTNPNPWVKTKTFGK